MNYEKLKERTAPAPMMAFSGTWRAIEWQPDLFKPQRFVVGVLIETDEQQRALRLMDAPGRIECFFRPAPVVQDFSWLMSNNRRTLNADGALFGHNLSLSDPMFVQGADLQATADELFDDLVVAATPVPDAARPETVGPDTEAVRRYVSDALKRIFVLDYAMLVREEGAILSNHHLDVTLAPPQGAGSVISACYRSENTIITKLLRTANDINAYAATQRLGHKALFIQVPGADAPLTAKERKAIEQLTGEEAWKLECAGFSAPRHDRSEALIGGIRDWMQPLVNQ
jgi:hypothetical protein